MRNFYNAGSNPARGRHAGKTAWGQTMRLFSNLQVTNDWGEGSVGGQIILSRINMATA